MPTDNGNQPNEPILLRDSQGREWRAAPLGPSVIFRLKDWLKREEQRLYIEAAIAAGEDPRVRTATCIEMARREVEMGEIDKAWNSLEGMRYLVWLSLRECNPEITEATVEDIFGGMMAEVLQQIETESGFESSVEDGEGAPSGENPPGTNSQSTSNDRPSSSAITAT